MQNKDLEPSAAEVDLPGLPRYGWFAGVLEGHVGEIAPLRAATHQIEALGIIGCDLEIDGGRFSLLFDETPVPGERLPREAQAELIDGLQSVVSASARPADIESTLRCSLVYESEVVETLLTVVDGELKPLSRRRPIDEADRAASSAASDLDPKSGLQWLWRMSLGRGFMLLLLVLLFGALFGWRSGYISLLRDAYFSKPADALVISYGPFGDTLTLTVDSHFAKYECKLSRGTNYPTTADAVEILIQDAVTPEDRAAANAVGNGGMIWIRLLAADGKPVEAVSVSLSTLLGNADGVVSGMLPASLLGERIDISLASGLSAAREAASKMKSESGLERRR